MSFGVLQIPESFSENYFSLPLCDEGIFRQDYVQCSTGESTPCMPPSFEKNGYCTVNKIDICRAGYVLKDGICIEQAELFRVDDPTFTRQSLQAGETFGNFQNIFGWFGLALSGFIVFAYVIMKIKKRKKAND